MGMGGMWPRAQRIDHPDVEIIEQRQHIRGYGMKIRRISYMTIIMTEAKSSRINVAMGHVGAGNVDIADPQSIGQIMRDDDRGIAPPPRKGIGEAGLEQAHRLGTGVAGDRAAAMMEQLAHIVDSMAVIGMVMRPQDRIDVDHVGRQQLRP